MFWRFTSILALALLLGVVPAQLDAFVTQSTGCHHNGTWYADKSLVPTTEKCLNCQCNKKTLTCRLKVCPEMPMPPPRGCVVVQKKNTCCPYLSCARLDAFYNIPNTRRIIAYLNHYERESIDRVVNENVLQRRSDDSEVDLYVCVKNGTVYKSGSAMSSSNLCTYCYCIGGTEKCVKPKCMLPVEGCKPIFVDSTCCPVRYDCSTKTFGKSSQEVNYRKTSNKHFLRMSQRLQRNRGCTVNKQFYAEGQKMKSDPDKPCDICFCIRGNRRCAPKKCSPALKNCIPVVPKGQCCPSSYDCGSQRDYRRAQNSRQFNFLSLLFGKDEGIESNSTEIAVQYPHDRQPPEINENNVPIVSTTSERSIFDTIREGLEFIDGNNNQMLTDNIDLLGIQTAMSSPKIETSTPSSTSFSSTTEVSFLDLLLGPTDDLNGVVNNLDAAMPQLKTTTKYPGLSWVDLLLGSDEDDNKNNLGTTNTDTMDATEATTFFHSKEDTTNIDRMDEDFDDFSGSGELLITDIPVTTESIEKFSTVAETNLVKTSTEAIKLFEKNVADNIVLRTEESTTELPKIKPQAVKISITPEPKDFSHPVEKRHCEFYKVRYGFLPPNEVKDCNGEKKIEKVESNKEKEEQEFKNQVAATLGIADLHYSKNTAQQRVWAPFAPMGLLTKRDFVPPQEEKSPAEEAEYQRIQDCMLQMYKNRHKALEVKERVLPKYITSYQVDYGPAKIIIPCDKKNVKKAVVLSKRQRALNDLIEKQKKVFNFNESGYEPFNLAFVDSSGFGPYTGSTYWGYKKFSKDPIINLRRSPTGYPNLYSGGAGGGSIPKIQLQDEYGRIGPCPEEVNELPCPPKNRSFQSPCPAQASSNLLQVPSIRPPRRPQSSSRRSPRPIQSSPNVSPCPAQGSTQTVSS
ncbi:uncharacterized protein LOC119688815 [Teleopsis dalmanni]|uniref:uncharacterized protein LOC119688815 n=1 Tax=Teleopsis dalmanni TaxID=139649 RepID=UPI0018CE488E|nr:uncharacterized protein LOC119688815 [Teleopsis dalmanni]